MNIDAEQQLAELAMAIEVVNKLGQLWDSSDDENRQGLAKTLFERVVYDLDKQQIVDFKLKAWAEQFFTVRGVIYGEEWEGKNVTPTGLEPVSSP